MGVAWRVVKKVLGFVGRFLLAWARFVKMCVLLFWHFGG